MKLAVEKSFGGPNFLQNSTKYAKLIILLYPNFLTFLDIPSEEYSCMAHRSLTGPRFRDFIRDFL